jgi:hypothetical protein
MTVLKSVDSPSVIHFACPECKQQCRLSERQRAVQHAEPTCNTWRAHRTNMQEFLRLALMAARGNLILGTVGAAEVAAQPVDEKAKQEILEQLYEGLKKL